MFMFVVHVITLCHCVANNTETCIASSHRHKVEHIRYDSTVRAQWMKFSCTVTSTEHIASCKTTIQKRKMLLFCVKSSFFGINENAPNSRWMVKISLLFIHVRVHVLSSIRFSFEEFTESSDVMLHATGFWFIELYFFIIFFRKCTLFINLLSVCVSSSAPHDWFACKTSYSERKS